MQILAGWVNNLSVLLTVICRCINTPVKRQYINAFFELAIYYRKRVAIITNFLSLIIIDIKGFQFNFGRKIFTGFEMTDLESYTSTFLHYFTTLNVKKRDTSTFKFCHFKSSEDFSTKIKWEFLGINTNEWQEVDDCCCPFSVINSHFKTGHLCTVSLLGY